MKRLAFVLAALIAVPASAQGDPRIREVTFRPGTVYTLRVVPGYVATVVLSSDERIQSVAIGNSSAWDVTPSKSGDHLFIRPLANGVPTNVELVTDTRHYSLVLQTTFEGDPDALFQLRFGYGEGAVTVSPAFGSSSPGAGPLAGSSGELPAQADSIMTAPAAMTGSNEDSVAPLAVSATYRITGDRRARPLFVSDDGTRTLFAFEESAPIPAIYAVDAYKQEVLVTLRQVADGWAVDRVWPEYSLRLGKAKARVVRTSQGAARGAAR